MKLEPLPELAPGQPAHGHVVLTLHVLRETDKALQVTRDKWGDGPKSWVPKSAVRRVNPNNFGGEERIHLSVWCYTRVREQL